MSEPASDGTAPSEAPVAEVVLPPPVPPEEPPWVELLRQVQEGVSRLEAAFDQKIRYDGGREEIISRLHADLQEQRNDLLLKVLRPVLLELIGLHDQLSKAVEAARAEEDPARVKALALKHLDAFRQDVEDILYRQGVETYRCEGETFDPRRQRAARAFPAEAPEQVGQVAQRLRPGFAQGERVLRPEFVAVRVANDKGAS